MTMQTENVRQKKTLNIIYKRTAILAGEEPNKYQKNVLFVI